MCMQNDVGLQKERPMAHQSSHVEEVKIKTYRRNMDAETLRELPAVYMKATNLIAND